MTSTKTHAKRMAELRQAMAAVPEESGPEWEATSYIAVIESALAYADSLAAQIEAERAKVAELEAREAGLRQILRKHAILAEAVRRFTEQRRREQGDASTPWRSVVEKEIFDDLWAVDHAGDAR